jgi:hypothetical protein
MDGGAEKPSNLVTLCKRCHLELVEPLEFHPQMREILQLARRRRIKDKTDIKEKLELIYSKCTSCKHYMSGLYTGKCKPECQPPTFKRFKPRQKLFEL